MKIDGCRICSNSVLIPIGSLGDLAISNFTEESQVLENEPKKYPLELVYCEKCTLLQLAHNTPRDLLYKDYWYQSHINPVIVNDLKEIGQYIKGGSHIDIGANDGTLFKFSEAAVKIAIDPSNIYPDNSGLWVQDYWEETKTNWQADYITAIACLYDLPNPNKFVQKVKQSLRPDGLFIAQLMTLQPMIDNNDVGNICHEHLEFYSYKSLVKLFEQNGLEIFKIKKNKINGGSYRLFVRHYKDGSIAYKEKEYTVKDLKDFFIRIEANKKKYWDWLQTTAICGYGASTKANTILQYYGVHNLPIVDVNPLKVGKYPSISIAKIVDKIPERTEYLWVFPYGFIDYFKKKEKDYKGKWITTIPEFKVI